MKNLSLESISDHLNGIKMILLNAKMNSKFIYNETSLTNMKPFLNQTKIITKPRISLRYASLSSNELKQQTNHVDWSDKEVEEEEDDDNDSCELDINKNHNNNNNKNYLSLFETSKLINRRSLPVRSPSFVWSTTSTSADGMTIVENLPLRPRSSSLKVSGFLNQNFTLNTTSSDRSSNTILYDISDQSPEHNSLDESSSVFLTTPTTTNIVKENEEEETTVSTSDNVKTTTSTTTANNKTSDYDSGESPNSSDYNSDTDKLQLKVI